MPLKGQAKTNYQRNYMRRRRLSTLMSSPPKWCRVCGEARMIEGHHIDESHDNESPANVIDLCPTCHRLLHRWHLTVEGLFSVRPGVLYKGETLPDVSYIDADGNVVYT